MIGNRLMCRRRIVELILLMSLLAAVLGTTTPNTLAAPRLFRAAATPTQAPSIEKSTNTCEPNDRREQACPIAIDTVNGPYAFVPAGELDYYRVDLGAPNGLQTTIAVRSSGSLDLLTEISRDGETRIGTISSPTISTTLGADIGGGIILRVENRATGDASGQPYTIEVRRTLPPPPTPAGATNLPPDKLENNWNPTTAAPIAVGVIYDLNFVCPVSWGCVGGDHDYLRLPVKRGGRYLICTFDLGPGVDTEIDLFWGTSDTPIAGNDDARPNTSFLSVLRWVAPADGDVIIRIAPRTGGTNPLVFDEKASTYRFAVALGESAFARQLEQRIAEQTNMPARTSQNSPIQEGSGPRGTSAPAPAPTTTQSAAAPSTPAAPAAAMTPSGATTRGQAIVVSKETAFRIAPNPLASLIEMLPSDAMVTLAGQYNGLWVSATTEESVLPGWILGTDLRRVKASQATTVVSPTASLPAQSAPAVPATPMPGGTSAESIRVREDAPLPLEPGPAAPPRASLTVSVTLIVAPTLSPAPGASGRTPTPAPATPLAGLRVQLIDAFGDLLAEAISGANGQVTFTHDIAVGSGLAVRIPATGLEAPIDPKEPVITIAIPRGGQP